MKLFEKTRVGYGPCRWGLTVVGKGMDSSAGTEILALLRHWVPLVRLRTLPVPLASPARRLRPIRPGCSGVIHFP
jgi:hypothetical protein